MSDGVHKENRRPRRGHQHTHNTWHNADRNQRMCQGIPVKLGRHFRICRYLDMRNFPVDYLRVT